MTAIEERDGVRFYVEQTSPLKPIKLARTPGFRSNLFELNGAVALAEPPAARRAPAVALRHGSRAGIDVLVVSLGTTGGWRCGRGRARRLARARRRGRGAVRRRSRCREVRTFALTDLVQARAVRRAARARNRRAIARARSSTARSPRRCCGRRAGAIWLDSIAAENRPGRHGVWQRSVERRRLAAAPLVMTMSERALAPLAIRAARESVPCRCRSSPPAAGGRRPSATLRRSVAISPR